MLSASGLDALISRVSHTVKDGLEHDLVETLLLDLAVPLGLGYHCRRAAGPSSSLLGSADGSSKLPSRLLSASAAVPLDGSKAPAHVQILSVACGVWVVEQASPGSSVMGKANESGEDVLSFVCKPPNSCAQRLQLIGCVVSSSAQVM